MTPGKLTARFRGRLWMIRHFGVRTWWRYNQAYRAGVVINYAEAFTPNELAILTRWHTEHHIPTPWETTS